MALPSQIAAADRKPKTSGDGYTLVDTDAVDLIPDANPEEYADARVFIRRLANRHDCEGVDCTHPRHTDDVAACNTALDLLGLTADQTAEEPEEIPSPVPLNRLQRAEQALLDTKPTNRNWPDFAACRGEDTELFFPVGTGEGFTEQIDKAKSICRKCPVRSDCLDFAVATGQSGIWGAEDDEARKSLRRRVLRRANAA